jgi:hypothetical protein
MNRYLTTSVAEASMISKDTELSLTPAFHTQPG